MPSAVGSLGRTDADRGSLSVGIVAGEASGDLLAASLLRGLAGRISKLVARGVGGPAMRDAGLDSWADISQLSVRGYAEVLAALPRLLMLRASIRRRMTALRPDVFVGVDAPDFNLALERRLRQSGIRTVHFISPSIWAWRPERIETIRQSVDHMLLVFPFEQALYDKAGIPATYVGHPLADVLEPVTDNSADRERLGISGTGPVIALLPGSRPDEIHYMARTFLQTADWIHRSRSDCRFIMPAANSQLFESLRKMASDAGMDGRVALTITSGQSHSAMRAADVVLVASGTATLEAALLGKPMTICYRMSPISYQLMRGKGLLPWIGLPNILCNETLVPEFIQDDATPATMGRSLLAQIDDLAGRKRLQERFEQMRSELRRGCGQRSAEVILSLCGRGEGA